MAQWIRHLTTNQGIPGSNPGGVVSFIFKLLKAAIVIKKVNEQKINVFLLHLSK